MESEKWKMELRMRMRHFYEVARLSCRVGSLLAVLLSFLYEGSNVFVASIRMVDSQRKQIDSRQTLLLGEGAGVEGKQGGSRRK